MSKRIKIPQYAKAEAKEGLNLRKKFGGGLTKQEADMMGISSGVERAKQIGNNKFLSEEDAKSVARFYIRFKNRTSIRSKVAVKLWGGAKFGKLLNKIYYS